MKKAIDIKLKKQNKKEKALYPEELKIDKTRLYIADTGNQGMEICEILGNERIVENEVLSEGIKLLREMTEDDIKQEQENETKEKEAFQICMDKIKEKQMPIKLEKADYNFDRSKITFYFTCDTRIDFRELVKDLAFYLRTRIEMKQIGVREKATMIGGCGPCGRDLCCCTFLKSFPAVSMRLAKEQNASSNPSKISGMCGRLYCCLSYEMHSGKKKNDKINAKSEKTENGR